MISDSPCRVKGQEDDTIAFDGNITIMPFNMKEEMQTGHFDSAGTYIFKKEVDVITQYNTSDIQLDTAFAHPVRMLFWNV